MNNFSCFIFLYMIYGGFRVYHVLSVCSPSILMCTSLEGLLIYSISKDHRKDIRAPSIFFFFCMREGDGISKYIFCSLFLYVLVCFFFLFFFVFASIVLILQFRKTFVCLLLLASKLSFPEI
ncbi:uncharacterized protein CYBJADRAFT_91497 [Cyberlindnera jadinii NRRL Y-1542]|uniref:Uncharacterized protein n=1 Tax=Cyberlindnera jadinii (strain ATCC 18201 / CBS 1600 / BCRC 20928 / JCM 3617 / NBRC 0987 / NRRL Y-1542) TaxID=983966 RepID=A0A1E4S1D2_CYBJN|nr:hypothetical protein CYBJADRAFT_91497 [Cyberlindnera jadinii NRRL Y-1542]ODV73288.1 hypothetical protein CYBJADRAFT_91497 [Cyberlindnera jadinii NRRL Y-1542]